MLKVEKQVVYKAFGLSIISEIPLPELDVDNSVVSIDIEIKIGDLSKLWLEQSDKQTHFVARENMVMFRIPEIGTFSIQDGKFITVSPIKAVDEDMVRLFILGTCMGVVLMQRKIFPLHGSAVAIDGKAYAIIGDSGAGKSTLASAFLSKGFQLLTDDVIAVSLSKDNIPLVLPSYPQQKLWQESLHFFGMEAAGYRPVYQRETKYAIPVLTQFSAEPLPLASVFELVKIEGQKAELSRVESLKQLQTLFCHTYRSFLIPQLGLTEWHFSKSTRIISHIDIFQLRRPTSGFTAHDLVSLILNSICKEER